MVANHDAAAAGRQQLRGNPSSGYRVRRPHSVCVNRNGDRFVDEACGFDQFGEATMQDQFKTGASTPCWLVFDATFRYKFTAGGIMPTALMLDRKIPEAWWDAYVFRAPTIEELAAKIDLDPAKLRTVVDRMNAYVATGVDPKFQRGGNAYDINFEDPALKRNPCLGPDLQILGDLGTKGGLKCDAKARVLDESDKPIAGLYAAGNASGSPFGDAYPGAGGTIGPAMLFGFIAANMITAEAEGTLGQFTQQFRPSRVIGQSGERRKNQRRGAGGRRRMDRRPQYQSGKD